MEGKILAAQYARTERKPYLGICLGMQLAVVEFARNVLGLADANSTEFDQVPCRPPPRPPPPLPLAPAQAEPPAGAPQAAEAGGASSHPIRSLRANSEAAAVGQGRPRHPSPASLAAAGE